MGRAAFLARHPRAKAWASLAKATAEQRRLTLPGDLVLTPGKFTGKRALVLGSGVAGLTTAYELLAKNTGMDVTVLEASHRTGGRCLTLRTGDILGQDEDRELFQSKPGPTQTVRFKRPVGDRDPYLNAGPGRIPSSHERLLGYLKAFGVELEVYVIHSDSNLVQMNGLNGDEPIVYRQLDHNVRGWIAEMVHQNAEDLLLAQGVDVALAENLKSLMISFGELNLEGRYLPRSDDEGMDEGGSTRAGYNRLPGVDAGIIAPAIELSELLTSEFWNNVFQFYQPVNYLWQPTLFQPVGGMDRVQQAFAQQVAGLGGEIHLNSPVKHIGWDEDSKEFVVQVAQIGSAELKEYRADYCFSNIAIPFLSELLDDNLKNPLSGKGFDKAFKEALGVVHAAQFNKIPDPSQNGWVDRFLACTTKVGWQAKRELWQISTPKEGVGGTDQRDGSELGVVPIFGGISYTSHPIVQIWYPSSNVHDELGVLTGTYNYGQTAYDCGLLTISERLTLAREGAALFDRDFAAGLSDGVAIAWQNMPFIKGGWAQWHVVDEDERGNVIEGSTRSVDTFNVLTQGTGVASAGDPSSDPVFFIVGDQLSSLPGWQEGAIASALNALARLERPDLQVPLLRTLPDTRFIVEGV
jgi:monoamine oxidase